MYFPNENFFGKVTRIRTMWQDALAHTVIVSADNTQGELLPYLKAKAAFRDRSSLECVDGRQPGLALAAAAAMGSFPRSGS